jgi:hypothetical protein
MSINRRTKYLVRFARYLHPYKVVFQGGILALALFIVYALVLPSSLELYLMPSLVALVWLVLFNLMLSTFGVAPAIPLNNPSFWQKITTKVKGFFFQLFAVVFILLTLVCLFLSIKMFGVWQGAAL